MNARLFLTGLLGISAALLAPTGYAVQVGPDGFNHIMTDSRGVLPRAIDPDLFGYTDITGTGTLVVDDDDAAGTVVFDQGRTLNFYGVNRTSFRVSTNGYLTTEPTDNGGDITVDCLFGATNGDRMDVLHDDLVTAVYYEYFPLSDVSVIQWIGSTFDLVSPQPVDFEILIYHSLNVTLLQVNQEGDGGIDSRTGMQTAAGTNGVQIACEEDAYLSNGYMAAFGILSMHEIRNDEVTTGDPHEFFEIAALPAWDMANTSFIAIGDPGSGNLEASINLDAVVVDPTGVGNVFVTVAETGASVPAAEYIATLNFEDTDNVTYALVDWTVTGTPPVSGTDLDTNDDGTLDVVPWDFDFDSVSIINDVAGGAQIYSPATVGPDPADPVGHLHRCPSTYGPFTLAFLDFADGDDTPNTTNDCAVCGDLDTQYGEDCDDGGESATCDADCTDADCGDGDINGTAGETCDDAGESADCDDDCTAVVCGDAVQNATAGETCDDGNGSNTDDCPDGANGTCLVAVCQDGFVDMQGGVTEACDGDGNGTPGNTATCDTDCTAATCGDSFVNNVAGETCDDGGRSATCNADCTTSTCGDGVLNATDGEQCDDQGQSATCDTDCTDAMCGDTVVNSDANEDCDEGGEATDCDDDCTDVACGDGVENTTAGEECDDNNTTNGDGCDSTCMDEMGMGGMGGEGGMGQGGMGGMGQGGDATGGMGQGGDGQGNNDGDDDDTNAEDGCSCSTPGSTSPPNGILWAALLGLAAVSRRRKRVS